jgi:excisionase family DNA binding protein
MATTVEPLITEQAISDQLYFRPRRAAELSGLSESEVYKSIYSGQLRALKYKSRSWLITRHDLEAWIASYSEPNIA